MPPPLTPQTPHRILFLCTGNYYRSRFAEILFNHKASLLHLPWFATSAGLGVTTGSGGNVGPISVHTLEGLAQRHIPAPNPLPMPRQVTATDFATADLVIALKEVEHRPRMANLHPTWADHIRYWHVHDLDQATPAEALREIETLLDQLLPTLSDTQS